jgi:hypothetical protein
VDPIDHLGAALGTAAADDDVGALSGEGQGDGPTDVAGGSGDQRGLAFESRAHDAFLRGESE